MPHIYYLSFFDTPDNAAEKRNYVLAATTKSRYICEALTKTGYSVEIVSASGTTGSRFCPEKEVSLGDRLKLHLFASLPSGNLLRRLRSRWYMKKQIWQYLSQKLAPGDVLVVYHSLFYMSIVRRIQKKCSPFLVIEANEIYSDVTGNDNTRKAEMQFLRCADAYILSTELLNDKINPEHKPFAVNYGTYQAVPAFPDNRWEDGRIHAVFAGVLEPRKGASLAVETAACLDGKYHIHILGFGKETDIADLQKQIREVSQKTSCAVTFDGKLSGDDYLRFIQRCQIGFSTQSPDADFNETSFPSKVLSYLSNGLRVVSVRIKAIETSQVAKLLYFYDGQSPQAVADAIRSIDFSDGYDSRAVIQKLEETFVQDLSHLLP